MRLNLSRNVKKIAINTASNYGRQVVDTVGNLLAVSILLSKLGAAGYGLVVLGQSLIAFVNVFKAGLFGGVSQRLALCIGIEDYRHARQIYSVSLLASGILSCITLLLGWIGSSWLPYVLQVPQGAETEFRWMLFGIFAAIAVNMAASPIEAVLIALEKFVAWNGIYVVARILFVLTLLLTVFVLDSGVVSFGISLFVWALVGLVGCYVIVKHKHSRWTRFGKRHCCWSEFRQITTFSSYVFIRDFCFYLRIQAKNVFINLLFGPEMNAVYGLAIMWDRFIRLPAAKFVNVLIPQVAKLHAQKDKARLEKLLLKSCHYCTVGSLLLFFGLMYFRETIFRLWLGQITQTVQYATEVTPVLVVGTLLILTQSPTISALQGAGRVKAMAAAAVVALVVDLALTGYLVFARGWYVEGFALGTMVNYAIFSLMFLPVLAIKAFKLNTYTFVNEIYIRAFLRTIIPVSILFIGSFLVNPIMITIAIITAAAGFFLVWKKTLDREEKQVFGLNLMHA